jgi:hypothetical protein
VHELTLGRSLGTLDQALELLATVERGPPLVAAERLARLRPYLDRLSTVVVIALSEDDERAALERGVRARGITCATLLVDGEVARKILDRKELAWTGAREGAP